MTKKFIPITFAALLSLVVTFSVHTNDLHIWTRFFVFISASVPLLIAWRQLTIPQKIGLSLSALIYNPIILIQLGSALGWAITATTMLVFFGYQTISSRRKVSYDL